MAKAPETCGVACDVPEMTANASGGTDETMRTPGASRSRKGAEFEKDGTSSVFVVAPTLIAELTQAGADMALRSPSLPAAADGRDSRGAEVVDHGLASRVLDIAGRLGVEAAAAEAQVSRPRSGSCRGAGRRARARRSYPR
jgi:hypothetical protein